MRKFLCLVLVLLMVASLAYGESDSDGSAFSFYGGDMANRFYDDIGGFNDGLARVKKEGKWGFINTSGTLVIPCKWDDVGNFKDGLATVEKDEKWGYIDKAGTLVIPCEWDFAWPFSEELAKVKKDWKYGYIDMSGTLVIPCEWDEANLFNSFKDGLTTVKKDDKYGCIDTTGTLVIPCEWDETYGFSNGLAMVEKSGKWGYIDASGTLVVPCEWDAASSFSEGLVAVERDGKWYSIDTNGMVTVLGSWDYVGSFSDGVAVVSDDHEYGLIDKTGTLVIPCEWDFVSHVGDGLYRVEEDDKEGCIDSTGTLVIPCEWDSIGIFNDGLAKIEKGEKYGFIDTTGKTVVPCEYDIAYYGEGYFTLLDGGYLTILDREGNEVEIIDEPVESSPAETAEDASAEYETLTIGSKGDAVKELQQRLNELGYNVGAADGDFGKKTESAIQKFQQANGLNATGIADAQTQALLYSDANVSNSAEEGVSELVEFKSVMMESVSEQISSAADLTHTENNRAVLAALLSVEITYQIHDDFTIDTTMPIFVSKQGNIAAAAFGGDGKYVMVIYQSKPLSTSYGFIYNDDPGIIKATLEASSDSVWTVSLDDFTEKLTLLNQQLQ